MKIEKRWKQITTEGRLVEPETHGPYYDEESLNDKAPFKSADEAVSEFIRIDKKHNLIYDEYIIVDVYSR